MSYICEICNKQVDSNVVYLVSEMLKEERWTEKVHFKAIKVCPKCWRETLKRDSQGYLARRSDEQDYAMSKLR